MSSRIAGIVTGIRRLQMRVKGLCALGLHIEGNGWCGDDNQCNRAEAQLGGIEMPPFQ